MRDPERIERILKLLKVLWGEWVDQRFGQFLINRGIIKDDFETWILEDDILEKKLNDVIKNVKQES